MKKEKNLLVIVDMVNGFIKEGALADPNINKITPAIIRITQKAIKKNVPIIAFKDCHTMGDEEFKHFPPHCLKGTDECDLIPELKPYEKYFNVIEKNTTNGFDTAQFREIAKKFEFDKVIVVGCCTDICVENFVTSFAEYNKKQGRNTQIIIPEKAVYTFDLPNHDAKVNQAEAIKRMKKLGITIYPPFKETENVK